MKFAIALFGSFKDSPGYVWKLPSGHDGKVFENIASHCSRSYDDGRRLGPDEMYGGYFIDVVNDRFFAFRFIDGGEDSLGRAGVVVTNWAVGQYSSLAGKDLGPLFGRLAMREMPLGENIEVDLPGEFSFSGDSADSVLGSERVLRGESAEGVFRLPAVKCRRQTMVEFVLKEQNKEASVRFLSPEIKTAKPDGGECRLRIVTKAAEWITKNRRKIAVCGLCVLGAVVVFSEWDYIVALKGRLTEQESVHINSTQTFWLPGCIWEETVAGCNDYRWGEFRIDGSKLVLVWSGRGGPLEVAIRDDEMRIVFPKNDSRGRRELSGNYFLVDQKSRKRRAQLSVKDGDIHFKVLSGK